MLGTFPKDFFERIFPKWHFPKRQLPKYFRSTRPQPVLASALGTVAHPSRSAWLPLQPAAPQRALPNLWEVAAWVIAHLVCCHMGNCHLGSRPWGNAFGKVPNTSSRGGGMILVNISAIVQLYK